MHSVMIGMPFTMGKAYVRQNPVILYVQATPLINVANEKNGKMI